MMQFYISFIFINDNINERRDINRNLSLYSACDTRHLKDKVDVFIISDGVIISPFIRFL